MTNKIPAPNEKQHAFWNGAMGELWVREQAFMDGMLRSFQTFLVSHAVSKRPDSVLDIGCGNGTTTIAIAEALGRDARVVGVDISEPMIANAQSSIPAGLDTVQFVAADASAHNFRDQRFDLIISRFGAMFFSDPVQALSHLLGAAHPGAETALVAWRSLDDNAFMAAGMRAAAAFPPTPPTPQPGAPGAFAFAEPAHVETVFTSAGWMKPSLEPADLPCTFPAADLDMFIENLAPTRPDLGDLDPGLRNEVLAAVRSALETFVDGDTVKMTARTWLIRARAPI